MEVKVSVQSILEKPVKKFPTHTSEFMNKVNERAKGTDPKFVGVIDNLFKNYYLECTDNNIKMSPKTWKEYHDKNVKTTRKGKASVKRKLKEMKAAIRSISDEMIMEWYDFFLYEQTFFGKSQEFLIRDYFYNLGVTVEFDRKNISENKIDIIIGGINCQVKPFDSRNPSQNRPIEKDITYIYYSKYDEKIDFYWDSRELDNLVNKKSSF